ncbi:hypothetical protein ALQ36_103274 [Pseudomonas syringae pv. primulae]|uniref:Uncharacterized protein n=1 Tax=Pseudomonas syringae pv. primulae TaxID=251707 RepID=A0A3M5U6Z6_9PSED|nr:hypothetical protein ALQ36_103274 [Pseudomonas syringae pv. primulae]RMU41432.1 hypothetical protein ALP30_103753 [Pseudomonas syringae pv. primulae]
MIAPDWLQSGAIMFLVEHFAMLPLGSRIRLAA